MNWFEYSQNVLLKVHFDRALFRKELTKLLGWLSPGERLQLLRWCRSLPRRVGGPLVLWGLLSGMSQGALAQLPAFRHDNGIIHQASDAAAGRVAFGFNQGQQPGVLRRRAFPPFTERWRLRTPDTSLTVGPNDVWGLRAGGRTYRFWRNTALELVHTGPICLYRQTTSRAAHYFFSRHLDAPVYPLTTRQIKQTYADEPQVLEGIRHLKWNQTPQDIVRETGTLRVLSWFAAEAKEATESVGGASLSAYVQTE